MTEAYNKLKRLLDELFQFDRADLDFGIYRIMNHKREEVSSFLDNDLLPQVRDAFAKYRASDTTLMRQRLEELERQAQSLNISPTTIPEYGETQALIEQGADISALEDEVYSDLYTFFRRYYKNGDFLSLRRYKEGTYAIPYEGEEVKLHWANADQYYVKTTESFRDYRFRLPDDRYVHFRLVAASTERDNNKAQNGKERRFVLREETPVEEVDGELNVYFEYRPHADNQKTLNERALEVLLDDPALDAWTDALRVPIPTEGNLERTTLEKHLGDYTARNSFDYFIHKDLGRFLRRELDFYLKNEVLHVDDLDADNADRAVRYLAKLGVIKQIGHKIIALLAQIEDFQKKLFEKKKFVMQADYCLTLDNVPKNLYEEIVANDAQYAEWERLFAISEIPANLENGSGDRRNEEWLNDNPYLVLDTKFFGADFRNRLLASIEDLDEKISGLLINGENFQSLGLLRARYRERIACIYIDPPYNAPSSEILYKNNYKHSSWLALMENRLRRAGGLLRPEGVLTVAIDENEQERLGLLLGELFPDRHLTCVTLVHNPAGQQGDNFSYSHDYAYFCYPGGGRRIGTEIRDEEVADVRNFRDVTGESSLRGAARNCFYPILVKDEEIVGFGEVCADDYHPGSINVVRDDGLIEVYPVDPGGIERKWRFARQTVEGVREELRPKYITRRGVWDVQRIKREFNFKTVWSDSKYSGNNHGTQVLNRILGEEVFSYPKSIHTVRDSVDAALNNADSGTVLDFFAGSGTTAHAVINLNREDGGNRRYVLVEMGEYFDSALKRRIQKVIYSKDWRDGKPVSREGSSHIFKYLTLESYEDTLNNVALSRSAMQQELVESDEAVREEYMLSYMLDNEASGSPSLLNSEAFEEPFAYRLKVSDGNETRLVNVDMVETFNYLLGLTVDRVGFEDGFRTVEGSNPRGERVLVIWRTLGERSNADLDKFFAGQGYGSRAEEEAFDLIYVNGDNNLENLKGKGERWRTLLIEEEFRRSMFGDVGDSGSLVGAS